MARLNDPPVPAVESIDALKRRFIRQNREIARVNSNQSLRIRNLEAEISRLLSENIALREKAIAAVAESERWRSSDRLGSDVMVMRERLEAKLIEVNALVGELGHLPEKASRRASLLRRRSRAIPEIVRSPNERDWKNRQTIGGEGEIHDGRLPAIMEDKYYPRRTLEANELHDIVAEAQNGDVSESPDLGPPPTVHFDVSDAIAFDTNRSPGQQRGNQDHELEEQTALLPNNLETRRKRRTSSLLQNLAAIEDEVSSVQEPTEPQAQSQQNTKLGAKRKLDVSELEDTSSRPSRELEEFVYQRKSSTSSRPKPSRFTRAPNQQEQNSEPQSVVISPQKLQPTRKILAPKSTNSPAKRRVGASYEKPSVPVDQGDKVSKPSKTIKRIITIPPNTTDESQPTPTEDIYLESEVQNLPPKTPAAISTDIMSPTSVPTEPSTKQTFIEVALTNSVEDVLNGSIGRGSRRARAAVSYAEPNLRDKMRRPGKALVGAVEGLANRGSADRESMTNNGVEVDGESGSETIKANRHSRVKSEVTEVEAEEEDAKWKNLPLATADEQDVTSPSRDREREAKSGQQPVNNINRRMITSRAEAREPKQQDDDLEKAVSRLSLTVFDSPSLSPITTTVAAPERGSRETHGSVHPSKITTTAAPAPHRPSSSSFSEPTRTRRHSVQIQQQQQQQPPVHFQRPSSAASIRRAATTTTSGTSDTTSTANGRQSALKRSASVAIISDARTLVASGGKENRPVSTSTGETKGHVQQHSQTHTRGQTDGRGTQDPDRMMSRRRSMMI